MQRFAQMLQSDLGAVTSGLTLPWRNGQTEGQIIRLKMLKRSMYGRAGVELFRRACEGATLGRGSTKLSLGQRRLGQRQRLNSRLSVTGLPCIGRSCNRRR